MKIMKTILLPLAFFFAMACGHTQKGSKTLPVVSESNPTNMKTRHSRSTSMNTMEKKFIYLRQTVVTSTIFYLMKIVKDSAPHLVELPGKAMESVLILKITRSW